MMCITCQHLMDGGVVINYGVPPRGMVALAFVRSPDGISVELLNKGGAQDAAEPHGRRCRNTGEW